MAHLIKNIFSIVFICSLIACSDRPSIYGNLNPDEDGVVDAEIQRDSRAPIKDSVRAVNQLNSTEKSLVVKWHNSEFDKLSFLVVDVDKNKILKNYYGNRAQRLASVTKVSTALGALENLNNPNIGKIANMLKISNNGEASRYVRLAAFAIDQYETPGSHYTQKHSCPNAFLQEEQAGAVVLYWLQTELPNVDWTSASLNDGAGCHYDNFMTPLQVTKILEYADGKGAVYNGKSFEELLSINGVDGTWKNKNLDTAGVIFAKTGTLNPNANLSGYFYAKKGSDIRKFYFSVFVNKKGGGQHSTRARRLIEELMRHWINYFATYEGIHLVLFKNAISTIQKNRLQC